MKKFFEEYLAIPLSIVLLILITPTVMLGGLTLAFHLAGILPEMGICRTVEKK
jgi:hypothetical protein